MLNYQALYYLLEVSAAQSFSLAAEKLHMTRPALSTSIKNLEKELGFLLLNRSHEGVTLTPQGEAVVILAQKGFAYFDEIEHLASHKSELTTDLSIYASQALNTSLVPALIKKYYEEYPDGKFNVYAIGDSQADETILSHPDCFVLSIFSETRQFADEINTIILDKSKSYLAMSPEAAFLPPEVKTISLKELLHVPLIETEVKEEQSFKNELLAAIRKYGEPNIRFTVPDMNLSSRLVEDKLGATFYISFRYLQNQKNPVYRTVTIKNAPKYILALLYHKDMPQEKVSSFLSLLNQI